MKRVVRAWLRMGLTAALAFSLYSTARADDPSGTLNVNGAVLDFSNLITYDAQSGLYSMPLTTQQVGGQNVTFSVMGDPDPVLSYSFSATNPNAVATPFTLDLSLPLMPPVHAGSFLRASFGLTLTDGGSDNITVSPFPPGGFMQTATGDGVDLGVGSGVGIDIGTTSSGIAGGTSVTSFSGTAFAPFGFSTLGIHLSFLLSPNSDNASFTGRVEVVDVPEPGTVAMIAGLGVSGSVFTLRRLRRQKPA